MATFDDDIKKLQKEIETLKKEIKKMEKTIISQNKFINVMAKKLDRTYHKSTANEAKILEIRNIINKFRG